MPRQFETSEQLTQLQSVSVIVTDALTSGLAISFIINLALNGVMSQLWNTFNTLQVLLIMRLLADLVLPSNALMISQLVDQVVNFSLFDEETLSNSFLAPIFGEKEEDESAQAAEHEEVAQSSSSVNEYFKGASTFMQVFQIILAILLLALLVLLVILCRKKLVHRCKPCFGELITMIKNKLMFNSFFRSILQSYLLTCLSMWGSFSVANSRTSQGIIDFLVTVLICILAFSFPIFVHCFLRAKHEEDTLRLPETKAKYDSIYMNVDYYKQHALLNTTLFLARRLVLAFIIVNIQSIVLQVLFMDCLSTSLLAYYMRV